MHASTSSTNGLHDHTSHRLKINACLILLVRPSYDTTIIIGVDIDECSIPNKCNGTCHNFDGGFNCTNCSHGKVYDPTKQKCVMSAELHNIILGKLLLSAIGI
jgi:hypothetical protein